MRLIFSIYMIAMECSQVCGQSFFGGCRPRYKVFHAACEKNCPVERVEDENACFQAVSPIDFSYLDFCVSSQPKAIEDWWIKAKCLSDIRTAGFVAAQRLDGLEMGSYLRVNHALVDMKSRLQEMQSGMRGRALDNFIRFGDWFRAQTKGLE